MCPILKRKFVFLKTFQGTSIYYKEGKKMPYGTSVHVDYIYVCVLSWIQTHNSKMFRNSLPAASWTSKIFVAKTLAPLFFFKQVNITNDN